jgi:hypothetical protein
MTDLWVVIPTATRRTYIPSIIKNSGVPENRIVIIHTIENAEEYPEVHNLEDVGEINIQRWWNRGINFAMSRGARYVALLNDDVELQDDPLNKIVKGMKETDSVLGIPYPSIGAICGYCMVIDLASNVRPDEGYRWWYGDNDIYLQAQQEGTIVQVLSKVKHAEPNKLTSENPSLLQLTDADKVRFENKWYDKS